jgi:preprotein translocase subunit YajC
VKSFLPLLILLVAFVFLIWLPMRQRSRMAQQTRQMQQSLTVGAEVMTTAGLYGRITGLSEETVNLEIAPGVVVEWARAAIREIRPAQASGEATEGPAEAVGE